MIAAIAKELEPSFVTRDELEACLRRAEGEDVGRAPGEERERGRVATLASRVVDLEGALRSTARDMEKYRGLFDMSATQGDVSDLWEKLALTATAKEFNAVAATLPSYVKVAEMEKYQDKMHNIINGLEQ